MKNNFQKISLFAVIVAFSITMVDSQGMLNTVDAEEIKTPSDSVGDIHVRSLFEINGETHVVDNFKVFNQKVGFSGPTEKPTVEVWGAPDYSHMLLYKIADETHIKGQQSISSLNLEFDVVFEIYQGDVIFRTFEYDNCLITNYVFTTLHDGEETFSGLTQFVYADVFEFECNGYHPSTSLNEKLVEKSRTTSSMDWKSNQKSTWSEGFR